jgi:hypothetical protein
VTVPASFVIAASNFSRRVHDAKDYPSVEEFPLAPLAAKSAASSLPSSPRLPLCGDRDKQGRLTSSSLGRWMNLPCRDALSASLGSFGGNVSVSACVPVAQDIQTTTTAVFEWVPYACTLHRFADTPTTLLSYRHRMWRRDAAYFKALAHAVSEENPRPVLGVERIDDGIRPTSATCCGRPLKVWLVGDSTMDMLFGGGWSAPQCRSIGSVTVCNKSFRGMSHGFRTGQLNRKLAELFASAAENRNVDVLVVNSGLHDAAFGYLPEVAQLANQFVSAIKRAFSNHTRVIALSSHAVNERKIRLAPRFTSAKQLSNPRVRWVNMLMRRVFTRAGFEWYDRYPVTAGMAETTPDGWHFPGRVWHNKMNSSVVGETVDNLLLNLFCNPPK